MGRSRLKFGAIARDAARRRADRCEEDAYQNFEALEPRLLLAADLAGGLVVPDSEPWEPDAITLVARGLADASPGWFDARHARSIEPDAHRYQPEPLDLELIASLRASSGSTDDSSADDKLPTADRVKIDNVSEFRVNSEVNLRQETSMGIGGSNQAVAMQSNGDYVVVWSSQNQDGSNYGVYAQLYDKDGDAQGGEFLVNEFTTNSQYWAAVDMNDSGDFVVVWTSENQDGNAHGIYGRVYNADGSAATGEFLVNTNTSGDQSRPSVAMHDNGFVVVYQGEGPGDTDGIRAAFYAGTVRISDIQVNTSDDGVEQNASVATNAAGDTIVVWEVNGDILGRRFDAGGTGQATQTFKDEPVITYSLPDVAMDADGNFVMTYRVDNSTSNGVWFTRYDALGVQQGPITKVSSSSNLNTTNPSVAMADDGRFVISYEAPNDGSGQGVYARVFDASGSDVGTWIEVNETTAGDQRWASVALQDGENFVVVWSGNGPGDADGVFARQFSLSDNQAPDGADSTISMLENTAYAFSAGDFGFSDPDGDAFDRVVITTLPAAGTLLYNGGAIGANDWIDVADIDDGKLVYKPDPDSSGASYATFTFQVEDDGDTGGSGVDLDPTPNTITIDVNPADFQLWLSTDLDVTGGGTPGVDTWGAGDIVAFGDPGLVLGPGVTSGEFSLAALLEAFSPGAQIDALHYVSVDIEVGASNFQLRAGDLLLSVSGETPTNFTSASVPADAGFTNDLDVDKSDVFVFRPDTAGTYTAGTFAMLLDDLTGAGAGIRGITLVEQDTDVGEVTLQAGDFLFTRSGKNEDSSIWLFGTTDVGAGASTAGSIDVLLDGSDGDVAIGDKLFGIDLVEVTTTIGGLELASGSILLAIQGSGDAGSTALPVDSSQIFALDIGQTSLTVAGSGSATASMVMDGWNVFLDSGEEAIAAFSIAISPGNAAPDGADDNVTTFEDTPYVFAVSDFGFSDSDGDSFRAVRIVTLPTVGTLTNNGVAVSAGDFVSAADIAAGLLVFTPVADENGGPYTTFAFQVQDTGGTAGGGVDLDSTPNTITIEVRSVNDAPAGVDNTVETTEDNPYVFAMADFGYSDAADGDAFFGIRVTVSPGIGLLTNNGVAVNDGDFVSAADIAAGLLAFTPLPDKNGDDYASFEFQVMDDGGTADGGTNIDPNPNTMTIDVLPVNDAPSGSDNLISVLEDGSHTFVLSDFGFSDPVDLDAFEAVRITSLPTAGQLTLDGDAVSVGDFIDVDDIVDGELVFTPAPDAWGAGYASFTFQVQDDGDTDDGGIDLDPVANTIDFNVKGVNDAPSGADNTVVATEDTPFVFTLAHFGFSDAVDGDDILAVRIATLPGAGTLTNDGIAVSAGDFVSAGDIALGRLVFTPAPDGEGAGYASFTFQVQDTGGTIDGGVDLDPTPRTMTIDVTPVNDAPVLDGGASLTLPNVVQDSSNPPGVSVTGLLASDASDSVTDVDVGAVEGIAVIGVDDTDGTWEYSLDGGASWLSFAANGVADGATSDLSAVLLDETALVRFLPDAGFTGSASAIVFRAWDQSVGNSGDTGVNTTGTGGTAAYSTVVATATLDVVPSGNVSITVPGPQSLDEDGTLVYSLSGGNVLAVSDGHAADLDLRVTLTVTNGTITLASTLGIVIESGADGSSTMTLVGSESSINAALNGLTFASDPNYFGPADLQVTAELAAAPVGLYDFQDSGTPGLNAATPGVNDGNVVGGAGTATDATLGSDVLVFDGTDDAVMIPGFFGAPASVTLAAWVDLDAAASDGSVIALGDNVALRVDQTFSGHGVMGFFYDGSGWVVTESATFIAGTGWHHVAYTIDQVTGTQTIYVDGAALNTTSHGGSITYAFGTDTWLGRHGSNNSYRLDGRIDDARIYDQALSADEMALLYGGGLSATSVVGITVNPVNDAPDGGSPGVWMLEDGSYTFTLATFGFSDPLDGDSLAAVRITTLPVAGSLTNDGVAVAAGDFISAADIAAGRLVFSPDPDTFGTNYAEIWFQVQDDGGTANGGVDLDPTPNSISFEVAPVNDGPEGANNAVSVLEDGAYAFSQADFGFSDPEGDGFLAVRITALPGAGSLTNNGVAVAAGDYVSATDIAAGLLVFAPAADDNGAGYTDFTFQVQDDGGVANGGVDLSAAYIMTVDVTAVNDAPAGVDATVATLEDTAYVFALADFGWSDADGDGLLSIRITTLPGAGSLTLGGVAVTAGDLVDVADIAAGLLVFTPAPDANGLAYASFTFQVQDSGGTADGGIDLDPAARTMTIDVTAVNDAPIGANSTVSVLEDASYVFSLVDFGFTDLEGDSFFAVQISTVAGGGSLTNNGVAISAGDFVNASDIAAGRLVFTPAADDNGTGYASFTFRVQDDAGTADGGADLDAIARRMVIDVVPVDDGFVNTAPSGSDGEVTLLEDAAYAFSVADFGFADQDGHAFASVIVDIVPGVGSLTLSGNVVSAGEQISVSDIAAGLLVFTPPANASGDSVGLLGFRVRDDGGVADGGSDTDATSRTLNLRVLPVNDAPVLGNAVLDAVLEDALSPLGTTVGELFGGQFADVDSDAGFAGIAVVANPASVTGEGLWQYSTDGDHWYDIGSAPAADQALVLGVDAQIRFVPAAEFNGPVAALLVAGLDNTYGGAVSSASFDETRVYVGLDVRGNDSALSADDAQLGTQVLSVNDLPVNTGGLPGASSLPGEGGILNLSAIDLMDVDAGSETLTLTVLATNGGVLTTSGSAGVAVAGSGSSSLVLEGTQDALNGFLDGSGRVAYVYGSTGASGEAIADRIQVSVADSALRAEGDKVNLGSFALRVVIAEADSGQSIAQEPAPLELDVAGEPVSKVADEPAAEDDDDALVVTDEASQAEPIETMMVTAADDVVPVAVATPTVAGQLTVHETSDDNAPPVSAEPDATQILKAALVDGLSFVRPVSEVLTDFTRILSRSDFVKALDDVRDDVLSGRNIEQTAVVSSVAISGGFTIGYVAWLARGGILVASLVSSMPAWRLLDPLPVLATLGDQDDDDDAESLASLVGDPPKPNDLAESPTEKDPL